MARVDNVVKEGIYNLQLKDGQDAIEEAQQRIGMDFN